jgi:thiosulfate/3-mercaptopyruvate sulfurtransferase
MEHNMIYKTLIEAEDLARHLDADDWVIVDCRFSLEDPGWGRQAYREAHIPAAVYAHLDEDLCGPIVPGHTGRHPLPSIEHLSECLSRWGIADHVQVVAYDDAGGAMAAARLWWLLRWLGHERAAVLNGGWSEWRRRGFPQRSGVEQGEYRKFTPRPAKDMTVTAAEILTLKGDKKLVLVDVRSPERYRGEFEPIDPVAGHIPGAISIPYQALLQAGKLLPPDALRERFATHLDEGQVAQAVFYCGSGVTAALSVLAATHAGLGTPILYPGSWSEWICDPQRPIETG